MAREYRAILERDSCSYCGGTGGQVDHIVPLARGGADDWENYTAACASCNQRKHARPLLEFMLSRVV